MGSICLLAPVPEEHLRSGLGVCINEGKVAFGSRAWETFFKLSEILKPAAICDALIYASESETALSTPTVTWRAKYLGFSESRGGAHKDRMRYRPQTTTWPPSDNQGHWALFWEVAEPRELEPNDYIRIGSLFGYERPRKLLKNFVPHGPTIVELEG